MADDIFNLSVIDQLYYSGCQITDIQFLASGEWVSRFDNTYWQPDTAGSANWDGAKWVGGGDTSHIVLKVLGSWADNWRPSKMRITLAAVQDVYLDDSTAGAPYIGSKTLIDTAGPATHEIDLTFQSYPVPLEACFWSHLQGVRQVCPGPPTY